VLALAALGATAALAQPVLQQIQSRGQINVGYRVDASPFSFRDGKGKPAGYMIDLCQSAVERVQAATGKVLRVNHVEVPVDQLTRYLQSGTVDMMCSATSDTPERRSVMAFSRPVFLAHARLLVRSVDNIGSPEQLRDQSVVVIGRTTADTLATQRATDLGWKVIRALDPVAAMGQLELGWAKAYLRDDVLLLTQLAQGRNPEAYTLLPQVLSTEPIAIAVRQGDPQLLQAVNDALSQAHRSGLLESTYQRWFMGPVAPFNRPINLPMSAELKDELARWR
jgi:glutamate/aspartate transport system substrate-binding protein